MADQIFTYTSPKVRKPTVEELAKQWDNLGFQIRPTNGFMRYTWKDGKWDCGVFDPAPYMLLHINSGALHYGVSCFEGLKAFSCKDGNIRVCNPELNAARMQRGARKLRMPEVPTEMFVSAVKEAVRLNAEYVPPYGHSASMYIRPLLFASGPMLGLAPLAQEFTFFVTVMPAGGYFSKDSGEQGLDALVIEDHDRAAPRGTGAVKAAGNYAADLEPLHGAKAKGYGTTLYLDPKERRFVEEFSVANFVGITRSGVYVTPDNEDSILASTTNIMLQEVAKKMGIKVEKRPIDYDAEIDTFAEVGLIGTAAVVAKVSSITRGERIFKTASFDILAKLRAKLTAIQNGEAPDDFGWMVDVCPARLQGKL